MSSRLFLVVIMVLAVALRWGFPTDVPPGFFHDEADKGYTAWCLAKLGRDLDGNPWPVMVRSLTVYTTPAYQLVALPCVSAMGLTPYATRLPARIAGVLTVLALFILARTWYGTATGLAAALLLAISPWHVIMSRWANQGILVPLALCLALWLTTTARSWLAASCAGLCWFAAFYAYAPAQLVAPLLLAVVSVLWVSKGGFETRPYVLVWLAFIIPAGLLTLWMVSHPEQAFRRFHAISQDSTLAGTLLNWCAHFNPGFLFVWGDANPRHSFPGLGLMYPWEAVTVLAGLIVMARRRELWDWILLAWVLMAPAAAACTNEGIPHALRSIAGAPAWTMVGAIGCAALWNWVPKRIGKPLFAHTIAGLLILASLAMLSYSALVIYPNTGAHAWEYGYQELFDKLHTLNPENKPVLFTGWAPYAYIQVLFWKGKDPMRTLEDNESIESIVGNFRLLKFGHPLAEGLAQAAGPVLVVARPEEVPPNIVTLEKIIDPAGRCVWVIFQHPLQG